MFDAITNTHQDRRQTKSGLAASAGLHLAIIGALVGASRLLMAPLVDKAPPISFPKLPGVAISFRPHLAGLARAVTPGPAKPAVAHRSLKPVLDRPVQAQALTPPQAPAESSAETGGSEVGSGQQGQGSPGSAGSETGIVAGAGGPLTYLRLSRAPQRLAGEDEPRIPSALQMQLRGARAVVLAKIQISAQGVVEDVTIVNSTAPQLDDIIRHHIAATWRFESPTNGGRPTGVQYLQSFRFSF